MKTYEEILQEVIDNATIEEIFEIDKLQKMQDEFANSLGISSIITDVEGNSVTLQSNFTCLCANYIRKTEEGLKQCKYSDSIIGAVEPESYTISRCFSAGLMDGGVSFYIGCRHIANWLFGQVRFTDDAVSDEFIIKRSLSLNIDPENFEREYDNIPVIEEGRFLHIARLASILAKKFSDEAYLKCVKLADKRYKIQLENTLQSKKERLQNENAFDFLTQLYSRNSFEQEVKRLELLQTVPVAVIVADVNNLKLTNDIFGHKFGDQLLSEISRIMIQESFEGFILGRCGGDEFNVLIPGGKRQSAEWFCHRVQIELEKNYNCCVMPSVAFGVGKKDHVEENIKDLIEIADQKMYRRKVQMKQKENFIDNIKNVLIGKGRLTEEVLIQTQKITEAFSEFMEYDAYKTDKFVHLAQIHNLGTVVLSDEVFANRFEAKLSIETTRELSKVPVINSKIANLYPAFTIVSNMAENFYENYNGTGIPNGIAGDEIPELSRCARVLCDYIYFMYESPIGLGKDKKAALKMIAKNSGKLYDPSVVKDFQKFILTYNSKS